MYADRVEAEAKRSVKERLNGSSLDAPSRRRPVTGKRQREDDKWEHDLFENDEPQLSNHKVGARDLRLKLQKKGLQSATQSGAPASNVRDLREKLSGIVSSPPANSGASKPKSASEAPRTTRKSAVVEASTETKSANPAHKKKNQQKDNMESFLESLGLEKYTITFQAEEVDMTALAHMTDEDLKAMGIPMGPRKKILLALESRD
ncbi:ankyrin repeat and SAM domain-containing protein 6 [Punica granatum]|uniref:Ankyrin repeat and SAM domain-containing protein 6 n=1 Tax=Punica granatum TaxID=22663 RepID=A0A218XCG9_PUNGR|nr:ankyrin repeat and SAM domain-containing protein 6 [Punica granatum]OWM82895.1 hypothetical protein CDL15_Pgr005295 [Punica granatum]